MRRRERDIKVNQICKSKEAVRALGEGTEEVEGGGGEESRGGEAREREREREPLCGYRDDSGDVEGFTVD